MSIKLSRAFTMIGVRYSAMPLIAGVGLVLLSAIDQAQQLRAQEAAAGLPGGASSLSENHGAWIVNCSQKQDVKVCAFSQQQINKSTSQRVVAVQLQPTGNGAEGILALPFGLALEKGAALQIDNHEQGKTNRFRACFRTGCIVPIAFDAEQTNKLREGDELTIHVASVNGNEPIVLTISLNGFSSALDRTREILQQ